VAEETPFEDVEEALVGMGGGGGGKGKSGSTSNSSIGGGGGRSSRESTESRLDEPWLGMGDERREEVVVVEDRVAVAAMCL